MDVWAPGMDWLPGGTLSRRFGWMRGNGTPPPPPPRCRRAFGKSCRFSGLAVFPVRRKYVLLLHLAGWFLDVAQKMRKATAPVAFNIRITAAN
jgi:hypothetical protein